MSMHKNAYTQALSKLLEGDNLLRSTGIDLSTCCLGCLADAFAEVGVVIHAGRMATEGPISAQDMQAAAVHTGLTIMRAHCEVLEAEDAETMKALMERPNETLN